MAEYVFFCKNCGDFAFDYEVADGSCCAFCNNQWINSGKTYDEWRVLAQQAGSELKPSDFARQTLIDQGVLHLNPVARQAKIDDNERRKAAYHNKPKCPKCRSTNIGRGQQGFGVGKAVVTTALTGFLDVGLLAGASGRNKVVNICNNCGHKWK